ncbi:unnamed protein product [Caenorhabditis nigoni]
MKSAWGAAQTSCQHRWNNSYLASEFTPEKHQFIYEIVKTTSIISKPYAYHIGLYRFNGAWYWDQPTGLISVRDYENWGDGYPNQLDQTWAGMNFETSENLMKWKNVDSMNVESSYICETAACDTDNYCDGSVDDH